MGNRLSEVETTAAGTDTTTYSYDANDRLLTETVTGLNPDTLIYSYDNNGNTLTRIDGSGTTSYAYDSRNRLSDLNSGQTTYLYDASGIRMSETSSGLTTNYLVDPNRDYAQVVEESFDLNSFAEVRYTYGDDLLAQHRRVDALTTTSSTYHFDGIGSTRRLTDTNSLVTDSYAYTAFGELAGSTGVTVNDYLYTGEQFDPNLGFYYLRARYYNAGIGRFQNMDTFAGRMFEPITLHKYLYAHGTPTNGADPSGNTFDLSAFSVANAALGRALTSTSFRVAYLYVAYARTAGIAAYGVNYIVARGRPVLNELARSGRAGVQALQSAFQHHSNRIVSTADALRAPNWNSFPALKQAMNRLLSDGRLNPANIQWHHVVEQHARNTAQFGSNAINSLANVVPMTIRNHRAISNFYSSGARIAGRHYPRFREYVRQLPWEKQYEIGVAAYRQVVATGRIDISKLPL